MFSAGRIKSHTKKMLELPRKQLEQQTIDRMMRDGNPRNNNG